MKERSNISLKPLDDIFSTEESCGGYPVVSIFDPHDLPDYVSYDSKDCPDCKAHRKIDALVNSYGYSKLN